VKSAKPGVWQDALVAGLAVGATALLLAPASAFVQPGGSQRPAVDISGPLEIEDGSCRFSPVVDQALQTMMSPGESGTPVVSPAQVGPFRIMPELTYRPQRSTEQADWSARAEARMPSPALWNGLRVRSLTVEAAHEYYAEGMVFADTPARVQGVLRRQGINAPLPPGSLDLPVDACAASLQLEKVRGGTALACSAGC
jgi:hypothetical protein